MKKIICLSLVLLMIVSLVACGGNPVSTDATTSTTQSTTSTTATTEVTTVTETTAGGGSEVTEIADTDFVWLNVGDYLRVLTKPGIATVTAEVKAGLGSKETVTLTVSLADGFTFDGWTEKNTIANLDKNKEKYDLKKTETITIEASEDIVPENAIDGRLNVIPNYSYTVIYHSNGGTAKDGTDTYEQSYSAVIYKCASTLPEQGYFVRDGYTLVEYNTKSDGTGYGVSLGSRMPMAGKATTELYCIWEKQNDASDFTYKTTKQGMTITGYTGTSSTMVIPDKIDGMKVVSIDGNFSTNTKVTKIVFPKTLTTIQDYAFSDLDSLESIIMFDGITAISDACFCSDVLTSLRVNAVLDLFSYWQQVQTTIKLDRLVEAVYLEQPLFLIYGGSGALNGIDGAQIAEATKNQYVVINMGSNAQCSAAYYFDWFNSVAKENDIVLWMPECGNWMLGEASFHNRLWEINSGNYDILRYIDISKFTGVFDSFEGYAYSHKNYQAAWDTVNINQDCYGDPISARVSKGNTYSYYLSANISNYTYMAQLIKEMSDRGVKMLWTYPAMDKTAGGIDQKSLEKYRDLVLAQFPELTCISSWETPLVPNEYMYDSEWHLTNAGAKYRTEKLVKDIEAALK